MANVREMKAQDVMRKGVETIPSSATVAQALKKMKELKVSSLIVDRRNKDDAYGLVTKGRCRSLADTLRQAI